MYVLIVSVHGNKGQNSNYGCPNLLFTENVINDVKLLGKDSRQGAVSFLPIRADSPWQLMSFLGWEQSTSDLVCKYLDFPGVYATIDGAVLNNSAEVATLDEKITVCPDDADSITDCWFNTAPPGTGVVGVICCEGISRTRSLRLSRNIPISVLYCQSDTPSANRLQANIKNNEF